MSAIRRWAVILAIFLAARGAGAQTGHITGSKHDFSAQAWAAQQICIVCHTPHNGGAGAGPLWNHASTTAPFTLYSSDTFDGTFAPSAPVGASRACLSCHDGTVALDSYGGNTGTTLLTGPALLGANLADDHPVSFTYDNLADPELWNPTIAGRGPRGGSIQDEMLFGGRVECASCHDVHNSFNQAKLLVKSNVGSALCLTCHDK